MAKNEYMYLSKEYFRKIMNDSGFEVKVRIMAYLLINTNLNNNFIPVSQTDLAKKFEVSRGRICTQFNLLLSEGIIESVTKYRQLYYRITPSMLAPAEERRKLSAG
jgi:biotin operon repressor